MGRGRSVAPVLVLATAGVLALPAAAADVGVRVGSFYFEDTSTGDGRVVADQGDRLVFRFEEGQHTATVDGYFDSGMRGSGATYATPALSRAGTFTLYCQVHGATQHVATLTIRATTAPSPSQTTAQPSPTRATAAPSKSPSPRPTPTRPASPSASPSPRPSPPSPSPATSPSPSASAAVVPTNSPEPSAVNSAPTPDSAGGPSDDVRPAVALDDGVGWLLPLALVLFAAGLGAGAIALGKRRRID
ncbi:MAG: hypothetical protein JJD92_00535 [Frankiaceae bacterium]|nr:hypothetical protein [Frankiaceae bacterium]